MTQGPPATFVARPARVPPAAHAGFVGRLRRSLFDGWRSTLLTLAERHKPSLLPHAVERLGDALSIARRHVPERVVTIKSQLYRAEHSLAMLNTSTAPEEHAT